MMWASLFIGFCIGVCTAMIIIGFIMEFKLMRGILRVQREVRAQDNQASNQKFKTCENCLATWTAPHIREDDFGVAWCQDCWPEGFESTVEMEEETV